MKTLSVIFENGEIMEFPTRCVAKFSMTYFRGNIEFILYLEKEANTMANYVYRYYEDLLPFDRIKAFHDVYAIKIDDDEFVVPYKGEDTNSLQSVDAFSNGDICIIINAAIGFN